MTREELMQQLEEAEAALRDAINDTSWRTGAEGPDAEYYEMLRHDAYKETIKQRQATVDKIKGQLNSLQ